MNDTVPSTPPLPPSSVPVEKIQEGIARSGKFWIFPSMMKSKLTGAALAILVVAGIPLTVFLSQQKTTLKQHASGEALPAPVSSVRNSNSSPVIESAKSTLTLPSGQINSTYSAILVITDKNILDKLITTVTGLPSTLTYTCVIKRDVIVTNQETQECTISGKPTVIRSYTINVTTNDQNGGVSTKQYYLSVGPIAPKPKPTLGLTYAPTSVNVSVRRGESVPALTITSVGASSFVFDSTPTGFHDGIWWDPMYSDNTGFKIGSTAEVKIRVDSFVTPGVYSGIGILANPLYDIQAKFPVKVTVLP